MGCPNKIRNVADDYHDRAADQCVERPGDGQSFHKKDQGYQPGKKSDDRILPSEFFRENSQQKGAQQAAVGVGGDPEAKLHHGRSVP